MSTLTSGNPPRIVFIGAGNVASHLAPALADAGAGIVTQVWSRSIDSARPLADKVGSEAVTDLAGIDKTADIYIICMADGGVADVIDSLPVNNALWLHTSGSLDKEILAGRSPRFGVLYPLQTFSKGVPVNISEVPFFIEGSSPDVETEIEEIAQKLSVTVHPADSSLRRRMHIAAVFACNFTNHLWSIADSLLRQDGLTLEVLHPLLKETLRKAIDSRDPAACQTGPAARKDCEVINKHLSMLPPALANIYSTLSESIINEQNKL